MTVCATSISPPGSLRGDRYLVRWLTGSMQASGLFEDFMAGGSICLTDMKPKYTEWDIRPKLTEITHHDVKNSALGKQSGAAGS